ncbi:MauE/DoxX family redox-associated membrane protein [Galbibacter sp. PAP.153]|uniref:MauE/DoxX family redox-associated membrane protein n=1 Tax=Galbibacter sp. PAP.153 TaxID=3104623 RepID=UPI00300AE33D
MKWYQKHTGLITEIISYLFILLFVYAAISKLLDFENFRIQLAQSPMLSAYAGWLAWAVPIAEIFTAFLLLYTNTRYKGLLASLALMVMFSTYIYIILNHASNIPCSCGGVLEKMGWKTHFIFNLSFIIIALLAILIFRKRNYKNKHISYIMPSVIAFIGIGTVAILFLTSERIIYEENPFIRRYVHYVKKVNEIDLQGNVYYYAGNDDQLIYLGDYYNPLQITSFQRNFGGKQTHSIQINKEDLPTKVSQVRIQAPNFYLIDGYISRIIKGTISNWHVTGRFEGSMRFDDYQLEKENTLLFKTYSRLHGASLVGRLKITDGLPYHLYPNVLRKQKDGVFDVDGSLKYDDCPHELIYTYYYRNSFTIMNLTSKEIRTYQTIDTISKARLKIDTLLNKHQQKLVSSLMVNPSTYVVDQLLYVRSKIKGQYEPDNTWDQSQTIDVYNTANGNYLGSFYIYDESDKKLTDFFIIENSFYGFIGNKIVQYNLEQFLKIVPINNTSR